MARRGLAGAGRICRIPRERLHRATRTGRGMGRHPRLAGCARGIPARPCAVRPIVPAVLRAHLRLSLCRAASRRLPRVGDRGLCARRLHRAPHPHRGHQRDRLRLRHLLLRLPRRRPDPLGKGDELQPLAVPQQPRLVSHVIGKQTLRRAAADHRHAERDRPRDPHRRSVRARRGDFPLRVLHGKAARVDEDHHRTAGRHSRASSGASSASR